MEVVVKSYGLLRERIGRGELKLNLSDSTSLRELFRIVGDACGRDIEKLVLTADGDIDPEVLVSQNGEQVTNADAPLSPGDVVMFLSPMPGG